MIAGQPFFPCQPETGHFAAVHQSILPALCHKSFHQSGECRVLSISLFQNGCMASGTLFPNSYFRPGIATAI
jgi:hypothetical protein